MAKASITVGAAIAAQIPFLREVRAFQDKFSGADKYLLLFAQGFSEPRSAEAGGFLRLENSYEPAPVVLVKSLSIEKFNTFLESPQGQALVKKGLTDEYDVKPNKDERWNQGGYLLEETAITMAEVIGTNRPIHLVEVTEEPLLEEDGVTPRMVGNQPVMGFVNPFTGLPAESENVLINPETEVELLHQGKRIMRFVALGEEDEAVIRQRKPRDVVRSQGQAVLNAVAKGAAVRAARSVNGRALQTV